jgi:hypothetical protein
MSKKLIFIYLAIKILIMIRSDSVIADSAKYHPETLSENGVPAITNFSPKDYGEHSQNWDIIQDNRGILYFGNGHGILEHDGISWRLIETPQRARVRSFAKDGNGTIFVGGSGDFGYLAPDSLGRMQFVSLLSEVPPSDRNFTEVWRTHVTTRGIYFQTFNKLFRWKDDQLQIWRSDSEFFLSTVLRDTLYLEHRHKGLMKMSGDSLLLLPETHVCS